jgi:hypothetical protein
MSVDASEGFDTIGNLFWQCFLAIFSQRKKRNPSDGTTTHDDERFPLEHCPSFHAHMIYPTCPLLPAPAPHNLSRHTMRDVDKTSDDVAK